MKKRLFGRGGVVLLAAVVVSAVVAAIALAAGPPSGTPGNPPVLSGTPAGQLSLNGGAPFPVNSFQWGAGVASQ